LTTFTPILHVDAARLLFRNVDALPSAMVSHFCSPKPLSGCVDPIACAVLQIPRLDFKAEIRSGFRGCVWLAQRVDGSRSGQLVAVKLQKRDARTDNEVAVLGAVCMVRHDATAAAAAAAAPVIKIAFHSSTSNRIFDCFGVATMTAATAASAVARTRKFPVQSTTL
jgi:hypothetical protein